LFLLTANEKIDDILNNNDLSSSDILDAIDTISATIDKEVTKTAKAVIISG
jgi:uncharacterized protein (DUF433 family)